MSVRATYAVTRGGVTICRKEASLQEEKEIVKERFRWKSQY